MVIIYRPNKTRHHVLTIDSGSLLALYIMCDTLINNKEIESLVTLWTSASANLSHLTMSIHYIKSLYNSQNVTTAKGKADPIKFKSSQNSPKFT